jgi:predicted phosphoribosyltransferase
VIFQDRADAGRRLAARLREAGHGSVPDPVVVLAIPRGGVVVGAEVARALGARLDVVICRKIGAPWNAEMAIGAVAPDGTVVLSSHGHQVDPAYVQTAAAREAAVIRERQERYRAGREAAPVGGRVAIVVDDGIATGLTVQAALQWLRGQNPARLVLAVPVAPPDAVERLRPLADDLVCLSTPEWFHAVGQFYRNFDQVSDAEVIAALQDRS